MVEGLPLQQLTRGEKLVREATNARELAEVSSSREIEDLRRVTAARECALTPAEALSSSRSELAGGFAVGRIILTRKRPW